MTTEDAKGYLSKREIPRLFESLMTGLMYHRPTDHLQYLIDCLNKVKDKGQDNITWSSFVDIRRTKTPLPPINGNKQPHSRGSRPNSRQRSKTPKTPQEEPKSLEERKSSPLPPISTDFKPGSAPVVLIMGGPGSGKRVQSENIESRYNGWVHLSMGEILRREVRDKGSADAKWGMVSDLFQRGDMVPGDLAMEVLLEDMKKHPGAHGFIIDGYPRDMKQVADLEKEVGRVDMVFVLDCDEIHCTQRLLNRGRETGQPEDQLSAIQSRISTYKNNTLPVVKHYDDQGKVMVFDADREIQEVKQTLLIAFDKIFCNGTGVQDLEREATGAGITREKSSSSSVLPAFTYKSKHEAEEEDQNTDQPRDLGFSGPVPPPAEISVRDEGRKPGLPSCPIVIVAGGPGSGKGTQCEKLCHRYKGFVHLSMGDILRQEISTKGTADDKWTMISTLLQQGEMAPQDVTIELLIENLKKHPDAKAFIIEGYPRDKQQVEEIYKHVGGVSFVLLIDCEEYYMQMRLIHRGKENDRIDDNLSAISSKMNFYKNNTLPILKHFDDEDKLVVINGDRDIEETFYEACLLFDYAFYGKKVGEGSTLTDEDLKRVQDTPKVESEAVVEEVIEADITPQGASTTGDNIGNPSYAKEIGLDEMTQETNQEESSG